MSGRRTAPDEPAPVAPAAPAPEPEPEPAPQPPPAPEPPAEPSLAEQLTQMRDAIDERLTAITTTVSDAVGRLAAPAPAPTPTPPAPPAPQDPPHDRRPESFRDRVRRAWLG